MHVCSLHQSSCRPQRRYRVTGVLEFAENEADWPECSWSTAYETPDNCPPTKTNNGIESIYTRLLARNK